MSVGTHTPRVASSSAARSSTGSAADVRAELHEALAAGGGPVTRQLFEDYYDLQSITVDRDEQFEALVRSSWIALVRQKAAARKKRG